MILYNVTVNIDNDVREEWLQWMKETHIPEMMDTGLFLESRLSRILAEEEGGSSYAVQYVCMDMHSFERYEQHFASGLRKKHEEKFPGKFVAFRTILQIVHEYGKG